MKKFLLLVVLLLGGVYGLGALRLSEGGTSRYLSELENLSLNNRMDEFCDRLHDDMEVSISDRSADPPAEIHGGKDAYCGYVSYAAKGFDLLGISTQVQRDEYTVRRNWLRPWTADITYFESRTTRMSKVNVTLETESDDQWTLVYRPFEGVKVMKLTSDTRLAD